MKLWNDFIEDYIAPSTQRFDTHPFAVGSYFSFRLHVCGESPGAQCGTLPVMKTGISKHAILYTEQKSKLT